MILITSNWGFGLSSQLRSISLSVLDFILSKDQKTTGQIRNKTVDMIKDTVGQRETQKSKLRENITAGSPQNQRGKNKDVFSP